MNNGFLKSSFMIVLTAMMVLTLAQLLSSEHFAKGAQSQTGELEGTWRVNSTPVNCSTGLPPPNPPITQALNTYIHGGSMLETGNGSPFRTPGHGIWQHTGGRAFTATLTFFRFDPATTAFAGTVTATKSISFGDDDNEFSATVAVDVLNVNGTTAHFCTTETGRRFE